MEETGVKAWDHKTICCYCNARFVHESEHAHTSVCGRMGQITIALLSTRARFMCDFGY